MRNSFTQLSRDVTSKIALTNPSFSAPPEVSVSDQTLGQQSSPLPPVAAVGHHREFQVQGGVDREPPMTVHPPPSGESLARGSVVGGPVQAHPVVLEVSALPSGQVQRQVTFDSASSPVGSEEVEDDDDDADSVVVTSVDPPV